MLLIKVADNVWLLKFFLEAIVIILKTILEGEKRGFSTDKRLKVNILPHAEKEKAKYEQHFLYILAETSWKHFIVWKKCKTDKRLLITMNQECAQVLYLSIYEIFPTSKTEKMFANIIWYLLILSTAIPLFLW